MESEYSFEEFKKDIFLGREIEFIYKNIMYFITHNERNWLLIKTDDKTSQCYIDPDDLIENARIDSMSLYEIWSKIEIDTIY